MFKYNVNITNLNIAVTKLPHFVCKKDATIFSVGLNFTLSLLTALVKRREHRRNARGRYDEDKLGKYC